MLNICFSLILCAGFFFTYFAYFVWQRILVTHNYVFEIIFVRLGRYALFFNEKIKKFK